MDISYTELGYCYYITNNYTDAITTLKKGLSINNKTALSAYYLGLTYIAQKDKTNAQQALTMLQNLKSELATKLEAKIKLM